MGEPGGNHEKPSCAPGEHELFPVDPPVGVIVPVNVFSGKPAKYRYCSKCDRFFWLSAGELSPAPAPEN